MTKHGTKVKAHLAVVQDGEKVLLQLDGLAVQASDDVAQHQPPRCIPTPMQTPKLSAVDWCMRVSYRDTEDAVILEASIRVDRWYL